MIDKWLQATSIMIAFCAHKQNTCYTPVDSPQQLQRVDTVLYRMLAEVYGMDSNEYKPIS